MCGIGGILRTDGQPIPEEWLDIIDARIAYRGPDGHGRFRDRVEAIDEKGRKRVVEVAFVHRRLSIIDHASGGQPMVSQRGRNDSEGLVAVVFNGCIYNHRELRKELESKGHRFVTDHSDTEVLIHGWREWDLNLAEHLEGMYAFAIWDRTSGELAVGRDLFGEKPLYVKDLLESKLDHPGMLLFASARAALSISSSDGTLDTQYGWTSEYLQLGFGWGSEPWGDHTTSFDLPPGVTRSFGHRSRYKHQGKCRASRDGANALEFEHLIECSVAARLEADVPLGCFLSGGVDSSLVALFAKRHKGDIRTYTVRMGDPRYDESGFAAQVADHLGLPHVALDALAQPADDLCELVRLLGQPFGDSSILPTFWVSKAAREHVKVALSGDGGDELFIGYERYLAANALARSWKILRLMPSWLHSRSHPKSLRSKIARLGDMARDYPRFEVVSMLSIFTRAEIAQLLENRGSNFVSREMFNRDARHMQNKFWAALNTDSNAVDAVQTRSSETAIEHLRRVDIEQYLPNDLLTKVDTASMACGLEVRCPFLDRDLARAALASPIERLMPSGQRKGLLRQIARKYLPKEIVDRPKMGFAIPIGEWFRNDDLPHKGSGMRTLLLDHLNSAAPFGPIQLNRKAVQRFIDEHMSGKRDHGQRLFTLLTLSIWAKQANAYKQKSMNA